MAGNTRIPGGIIRSGSIPTSALGGGVVSSSAQTVAHLINQDIAPANITASGHIVPSITETYDLGSPESKFRDLYLSGSTIYLGTLALSDSGGTLAVSPSGSPTGTSSPVSGAFTGSFLGNVYATNNVVSRSTQVKEYLPDGVVSSSNQYPGWVTASSQVDITQTTNYTSFSSSLATADTTQTSRLSALENVTGSYATTGSNIFVGTQSFNDTTNTTSYLDGAIHVAGGMSVRQDLRVSGSVTINGLLTAVSMSTQYVTSSQYNVGVSKITLNDDDVVRFAGISIYDSGSASPTSASIYWDSLQHRFIYENLSGSIYNSSILMAGPKHTGSLGDEVGLTSGYVPYATGNDHIDNSVIYQSGSNIGIGTTTPTAKLEVVGDVTIKKSLVNISLDSPDAPSSGNNIAVPLKNANGNILLIGSESASVSVVQSAGPQINVGIGTTNPQTKIDVFTTSDGIEGISARSSAGGFIRLLPSASVGAYNSITSRADTAIIFGNGSGGGRLVIAPSASGTSGLVISGSSGNVGIGTTLPLFKLDVVGGAFSAASTLGQYSLANIDNNSSTISPIAGGGYMSLFAGDIHLRGYWGVSVDINGGNGGDGSDSAPYTRIAKTTSFTVNTRSSTTAFTNLFTIRNSGNVGIGTTSPSAPLHVYKNDTYSAIISRSDWNNGVETRLGLGKQYGVLAYISTYLVETVNDTSYIALNYRSGAGPTFSEGLRVHNNGNVGIGTTNPGEKLTVNGGNISIISSDSRDSRFIKVYRGSAGLDRAGIVMGTGTTDTWFMGHYYEAGGATSALVISENPVFRDGSGTLVKTPVMSFTTGAGTAAGNVGIGTTNISAKLHVNGNTRTTSVFGEDHFSGWIAANLGAGESGYWCVASNTGGGGEPASKLILDVIAASWTVWNMCRVVIDKRYDSSEVNASISGYYNRTTTVSVVTVNVGGTNYLAIRHTGGDSGLVVTGIQVGQSLASAFYTKSGTVVTTHASYP